jgi:CopG family nickel-responsive transcriptional regulator
MSELSRFGVAMETSLLAQFDQLVRERGSSRSELFRDLARGELMRSLSRQRVEAFASVTIVYNHHVRELSERITDMQHDLGDQVRSTMHVHLDHDRCLEIIVMRGRADKLQLAAEKLFATRGILHGSIEIVAVTQRSTDAHTHDPKSDDHAGHTHPRRTRARR